MKTDALIEKLSEIHPKGFDLSLGRITDLLEKLGNPHRSIPPAIHVAGTNGKGSTLAFCRAILEEAGYRVHVHTSPHLVNWQERYRLAGELVSDDVLADAVARAAKANNDRPITIFEIMSAVMFMLFSEHEADFSLVEVGLGGRFDATNMISKPLVSVITPVAMDHQAYLGDTLEKIAFEKAGIIKPDCPVVLGEQEDEARNIIEEVAAKKGSHIQIACQEFDYYEDATGFVFQDADGLMDLPMPRLAGRHQLANAGLAIAAIRATDIDVDAEAYSRAMQSVYWPGRLEKLPDGRITEKLGQTNNIWIDGGHNPNAGEVIAAELQKQNAAFSQNTLLVCGMINTKDPTGYFKQFVDLKAEVITVPVNDSDAGIDPNELAKKAIDAGLRAQPADSLEIAFEIAKNRTTDDPDLRILLCGSLYMVGEVLKINQTPPK